MYINAKQIVLAVTGSGQNWVTTNTASGRLGTALNDVFYASGAETLLGGFGNDSYTIWDTSSKIIEYAGQGIDTIYSYAWGKVTLSANVENLFLLGSGSTGGFGNASDNIIVAGDMRATLNGYGGDDILVGGKGADAFIIQAGNGSDVIENFQSGFDAVQLQGYGVTSFAQLKSLGKQVGSDVQFTFSNGEKLVLRDTALGTLHDYDFQLSSPLTASTGQTLQTGNGKCWTGNGWYVLNNAWGASDLSSSAYTIQSAYNKADMTAGTTFAWSFPLSTDAFPTIKAYPEVIFGVSPHGDRVNATDKAHVFPLQISSLVSLKADFDVSHSGNSGGYNVAYDIWLTSQPNGDASTITNEVMVWLHKGDFPPFGDVVGTYTDGEFHATVYHTGTYTAVVADKDWNAGTLDLAKLFAGLNEMGIIDNSEYVASIELGSEVVSGQGTLTINNLDITAASKAADGSTIIKTVTGAGTTVETVTPVPAKPVNTAPIIDSDGGAAQVTLHVDENKTNVTTVHAKDAEAASLSYSIVGGADSTLFKIDQTTGALSFKAAPNYEAATDANHDNIYLVTVRASDGSLYADQAISIAVDNVNEAPMVAATSKALNLVQGAMTANISIGASDPDGDALSYALKAGASPAHGKVVFDAASGSFIYTATDASFIGKDGFTILVSDGHGGTVEQVVDVAIDTRIDTYNGTAGADLRYGSQFIDHMNGGDGSDFFRGADGNDVLHGDGGNDTLFGEGGDDTLYGDDGNDLLYGGVASDALYGGAGNDKLDGGEGADRMEGGTGDDIYYIDNAGDVVVEYANEGTDTVYTTINYTLSANVEIGVINSTMGLSLTGNDLANNLYGGTGNDSIYGGGGMDFIRGGAGNDSIYGDEGNDTLLGEDGNDFLYGGIGNDTLYGGAGVDMLTGGTGVDRFVFTALSDSKVGSPDHITDFNRAEGDLINLTAIDAVAATAVDNAFTFIGQTGFGGVAGQLRYAVIGGSAHIYGDVNGDKIADFEIVVDGHSTLLASDFML